jgi:hypothetical protein
MPFIDLAKRVKNNKANAQKPAAKPVRRSESTLETYTFDYNLNLQSVEEFVKNKRFAATYVGSTWGECGTIITTDDDYIFYAPDTPDQDDLDDPITGPIVRMQYQVEYGSFIKEKAHDSSNKPRVYAYLWGKCTPAMQNAIRMDPLFNRYEQARDPVRLWRRISDISMNGTGLPENEAKKMENARFRFDKINQKSTETVGEFYERFVQNYDAMTSQGSYLYNECYYSPWSPTSASTVDSHSTASSGRSIKSNVIH